MRSTTALPRPFIGLASLAYFSNGKTLLRYSVELIRLLPAYPAGEGVFAWKRRDSRQQEACSRIIWRRGRLRSALTNSFGGSSIDGSVEESCRCCYAASVWSSSDSFVAPAVADVLRDHSRSFEIRAYRYWRQGRGHHQKSCGG